MELRISLWEASESQYPTSTKVTAPAERGAPWGPKGAPRSDPHPGPTRPALTRLMPGRHWVRDAHGSVGECPSLLSLRGPSPMRTGCDPRSPSQWGALRCRGRSGACGPPPLLPSSAHSRRPPWPRAHAGSQAQLSPSLRLRLLICAKLGHLGLAPAPAPAPQCINI